MQLFSKVKYNDPHNEHANFKDPIRAFIVLFRSFTGEGWNELMHALAKKDVFFVQVLESVCVPESLLKVDSTTYPILKEKCLIENPNACGQIASYPYFILFTFILTTLLLNLVVAVILDAFQSSAEISHQDVFNTCMDLWRQYDPDLSMKLCLPDALKFIREVADCHGVDFSYPWSFHGNSTPQPLEGKDVNLNIMPMKTARKLDVMRMTADGQIHFFYVVEMAISVALAKNDLVQKFQEAERIDQGLSHLRKSQINRMIGSETALMYGLTTVVAANKIQHQFRKMREIRNREEDQPRDAVHLLRAAPAG